MKNKYFAIMALAASLMSVSCSEDKSENWSVEVNIKDAAEGDKVSFSYLDPTAKDTIEDIVNGTARMEKKYTTATYVNISILPHGSAAETPEYYSLGVFINDPDEHITIDTHRDSIYLSQQKGGMYSLPSYDTIRSINRQSVELQKQYIAALSGENAMSQDELMALIETHARSYMDGISYFISQNPDLYYSAYLLINLAEDMPFDSLKKGYDSLSERIKSHEIGQNLSYVINMLDSSVKEGFQAIPFTLTDIDGKTFSLDDYKGKWVLVDFWGSWCSPCRKTNPHLVELYKKYKDKGFEIIGLVLNDTAEKVRNAMKQDGITWRNAVINEQQDAQSQSLPMTYNIKGVPTKILIDPHGMVHAIEQGMNTGNSRIDEKLMEVFK